MTSQIVIVIFFLVPGSTYLWTYERLAGRLPITGTDRLLRAVAMSAVIYALASTWVVRLAHLGMAGELRTPEGVAAALVLLLIGPFALGATMAQLRRHGVSIRWLSRFTSLHPSPTAWDYAFEEGGGAFIRAKLKNGTYVGGVFGARSFASSYPEPPSLFLETAWRLDDHGQFVRQMEGSKGVYIGLHDIESVEWLEVRRDGEEHA